MQTLRPSVLGSRRYSFADQKRFAELSGDWNPIHIDPVAARRSVVGGAVVHGVHLVLWSLDLLARSQARPLGLCSLDVRFLQPVLIDDEVTLALASQTADEVVLKASIGGKPAANIKLGCCAEARAEPVQHDTAILVEHGLPRDNAFDVLAGMTGQVGVVVGTQAFADAFPAAADLVGRERLRDLAACSRLVGMDCPGLRSVFSRLTVKWEGLPDRSPLAFAVIDASPRFNRVVMRVGGNGMSGEIEAFSPPEPPRQLAITDIASMVGPREFAGQTALVIGGSRGLGELTAKIVASGGGHVIVSYAVGESDAARVVQEIRAFGGTAEFFRYDVNRAASEQFTGLGRVMPSHVYYLATCQITPARVPVLDRTLLNRFMAFYVHGFFDLCHGLSERGVQNLKLFYPSTVYVEERPKGMTEYAMAKAAGEALCQDISRYFRGFSVHRSRLPRLLTDQTASVTEQILPQSIDVLLPIIRSMA